MKTEEQLRAAAQSAQGRSIEALYASEPGRIAALSLDVAGLHLDFTKQQVSAGELAMLEKFATDQDVAGWRKQLFDGAAVNNTEGRAVLHPALRDTSRDWHALDLPVREETIGSQSAATAFAHAVRSGAHTAADGRPFKAIVHLGIGGSDLGPRLVHEALAPLGGGALQLRFAANIEPNELNAALHGLDPRETLVVCVSKTFTTIETLTNLAAVRAWMAHAVADDSAHLVAVSAVPDKAVAMGFERARVFDFRDWVGGRYSLWSAVSLSVEIALGPDVMAACGLVLRPWTGLSSMPRRWRTPRYWQVFWAGGIMMLWATRAGQSFLMRAACACCRNSCSSWIWNPTARASTGTAIPLRFPARWSGVRKVPTPSTPSSSNLHQSPTVTPVEFICLASDEEGAPDRSRMTLANALAQAEALMRGKAAPGEPHRAFSGKRPSSMILMDALTPQTLGALLAFYEHRTFVEGVLWGINSFDQWGVELGKVIAREIDADLQAGPSTERDPGTAALIRRLRTTD